MVEQRATEGRAAVARIEAHAVLPVDRNARGVAAVGKIGGGWNSVHGGVRSR
jgi:hypothetical protein